MSHALFTRSGPGGAFVPTDRSRGPWSPEALHGSPVAALLAFCVEERLPPLRADGGGLRLARLTVDLFRPVPYGELAVSVEPIREGRRLALYQVALRCEGRLLTQGSALCLLTADALGSVGAEYGGEAPPPPEAGLPNPLDRDGNRWVSYPGTLEMRRIVGPGGSEAPIVWIKTDAPVLADAPLTPAVRAAAIADFVSPFANMQPGRSGYVNADITMQLHRPPAGEWHFLRVVSRGAADGVAAAQAVLGDRRGAYGGSSAVSLINP